MKRTPEFDPRRDGHRRPAFSTTTELDGLISAGMKKEALALARRFLKARTIAPPAFARAVRAVLVFADNVRCWKRLVESAYERVPQHKRASVRFWMMSICIACIDNAGVLRLVPKRFTGEHALQELLWAMEAAFATDSKKLMRKLARRLPKLVCRVNDTQTQALLLLCLSEFYAREGKWAEAIAAAEPAQECSTFLQSAVTAVVEIHAARALRVVQQGFQRIDVFSKKFDPQTELTVPGNERALLDHAAKEFRRLQKMLEGIVPVKRRRQLGF
jgi:hypothetical protein